MPKSREPEVPDTGESHSANYRAGRAVSQLGCGFTQGVGSLGRILVPTPRLSPGARGRARRSAPPHPPSPRSVAFLGICALSLIRVQSPPLPGAPLSSRGWRPAQSQLNRPRGGPSAARPRCSPPWGPPVTWSLFLSSSFSSYRDPYGHFLIGDPSPFARLAHSSPPETEAGAWRLPRVTQDPTWPRRDCPEAGLSSFRASPGHRVLPTQRLSSLPEVLTRTV